jgi:hypothetical protein
VWAELNSMEAGEVGVFCLQPEGKIHHFYTAATTMLTYDTMVASRSRKNRKKAAPSGAISCAAEPDRRRNATSVTIT